jgi:hypothetical protein
MIISATLTNREGCQFDSLQFPASSRDGAVRLAKMWAAGRGGRYSLTLWDRTHEGYGILLENFRYSGKCRRAV